MHTTVIETAAAANAVRTTAPSELGSFTYYRADRYAPFAKALHIFTCWNPDHTSCCTHSVTGAGLAENICALERQGWIDRTARGERWCWRTKAWTDIAKAVASDLASAKSQAGEELYDALTRARDLIVSPGAGQDRDAVLAEIDAALAKARGDAS